MKYFYAFLISTIITVVGSHTIVIYANASGIGGSSGVGGSSLKYKFDSWTPRLQDETLSDAEGQTYTIQTGKYVRINNVVFVMCRIILSSKGTLDTNLYVEGLPYPPDPGSPVVYSGDISVSPHAIGSTVSFLTQISSSTSTRAQLLVIDTISGSSNLLGTEIQDNTAIIFTAMYTTIN